MSRIGGDFLEQIRIGRHVRMFNESFGLEQMQINPIEIVGVFAQAEIGKVRAEANRAKLRWAIQHVISRDGAPDAKASGEVIGLLGGPNLLGMAGGAALRAINFGAL